jgi:spore germination cell wall hydrolase CwlJ-like protein
MIKSEKQELRWSAIIGATLLILGLASSDAHALDNPSTCLALNIYHESLKDGEMREPLDGMFAIAQTVLNRAGRDYARVCAVVQARSQFSWTSKPPAVTTDPAWVAAQQVAQLSLHMNDFTGGATHYHALWCLKPNDRCNAYWRTDMDVAGTWGSHIFYRPRVKR